jgi:hypothetical protein
MRTPLRALVVQQNRMRRIQANLETQLHVRRQPESERRSQNFPTIRHPVDE